MRSKLLNVILLMTLVPLPVRADYFDGNALVKLIDSPNAVELGIYRGYVAGVQDLFNGTYFCVPEKVRLSQASEIVTQYMKQNPKRWHEAAKVLVIDALKDAFACKRIS